MKQFNAIEESLVKDAVSCCVGSVMRGYKKATYYISSDLTVKATRQFKMRKNERQVTVVVTIGKPNFSERGLIKKWRKYGMSLPEDPMLKRFKE